MFKEIQIKTTMKYQLTPVRMATIKRQEIASDIEGVEKMEPLSAVGGSEYWFNPFGKLMWRFHKNTKYHSHMIQLTLLWVYIQRKWEQDTE